MTKRKVRKLVKQELRRLGRPVTAESIREVTTPPPLDECVTAGGRLGEVIIFGVGLHVYVFAADMIREITPDGESWTDRTMDLVIQQMQAEGIPIVEPISVTLVQEMAQLDTYPYVHIHTSVADRFLPRPDGAPINITITITSTIKEGIPA